MTVTTGNIPLTTLVVNDMKKYTQVLTLIGSLVLVFLLVYWWQSVWADVILFGAWWSFFFWLMRRCRISNKQLDRLFLIVIFAGAFLINRRPHTIALLGAAFALFVVFVWLYLWKSVVKAKE
ncbi:hypothetical protein [Schleiferilactobacillus perolens]|uniref:Uncharacterized protein n=1 Tax=Schleiferilactobacillus perolens DSM 12744 TaxID=1423792 RepID=A0A0R1MW33_9LACO|nr:hypothetical protein [Schleiferilactobacillus perolens]KRL10052.1 hypothetical protein FD09_GL000982 [Schleiferilactobacillus perolens DSM 12744]